MTGARPLANYRSKRNFAKTAEPRGTIGSRKQGFSFVVQKHAARRLHYDFRLELDGVLLSWAVPKGPSLDPRVKRLAMHTEDHPVEYGDFEGIIPKGEYGGGTVEVWDCGVWVPHGDPKRDYERGRLSFELRGTKLHGGFHLVKAAARTGRDAERKWLLFKSSDSEARPGSGSEVVDRNPNSALSGRSIDQIERDPGSVWHSEANGPSTSHPSAAAVPKSRKAPLPAFVGPELATLVDEAPEGDDWLHEIKLDGYRILARLDRGRVTLETRRGHDWASRIPTLASLFRTLPFEPALFDGEIVVVEANGITNFQRLQNSLQAGKDAACIYFLFDILHYGGRDLRRTPLLERKQFLADLLSRVEVPDRRIRLSEHIIGRGRAFFRGACELGAEGIVSKRLDAPYTSGRSRAWLKVKCHTREEFVVGGYTDPSGARGYFGALLLGTYDDRGALQYAGKVGTGFTRASLKELYERLAPLSCRTPAFADPPRGAEARGVHWIRPELVAQVQYTERTDEGFVRHASFQGLRADKSPSEVRPERPLRTASSRRPSQPPIELGMVRLTHPDRVLYEEQGVTKGELALYYARVARWMLPFVARRPLMLVRCPEGQQKHCFHQKHPAKGMPASVHRFPVREKAKVRDSLFIDDADGLMGLVQMGALEIHVWASRVDRIEKPDQLVFDLDPDPELEWARIAAGAKTLRTHLSELGLDSYAKVTGGKGLHVVVPIRPRIAFPQAKAFSRAVVERMVRAEPDKYLSTMTKSKRRGKIFLDYLRNGRGATAIAPFSTRARVGAPVSVPIAWSELGRELPHFEIRNLPARLEALERDPWEGFLDARQFITAAMMRAVGVSR